MPSVTKKHTQLCRFIILILMFISACKMNFPDNNSQTQNLKFQNNHEFISISPLITSSGFSINVPRDWVALPSEKETLLKNAIEMAQDSPAFNFIKAYQSINLSTLIINKVQSLKENFLFLPKEYYSLLQSQFESKEIHQAEFSVNSLPVKQFIIQTNSHVIILLYVGGKSNYQLKFIIPNEVYESEIDKIESSIGTITNIGEKR